jgi:transcriptional regulator with XRE-family HTH domain
MAKEFHEEVMKTFAKRLRQAREAAGYASAKDFADVLGVEPPAYRYWERGGASPNLSTLTRICQLLDVEPNDLLPLARKRRPSHDNKDSRSAA